MKIIKKIKIKKKKKKPNENKVSLFQNNNPKPEVNIFALKINDSKNSTNIQNKGDGIFNSIQNINIKKRKKHQLMILNKIYFFHLLIIIQKIFLKPILIKQMLIFSIIVLFKL